MNTKLWLGTSLVLNGITLGLLLVVALRPSPSPSPHASPPTAPQPEAREAGRPAEPAAKPPLSEPANAAGSWIQALRAAGVAEKLVADVAAADFEDRWHKRMREMQSQFNRGDLDEVSLERFYAQHDVEQENELRAALGEEGFRRWDRERILREFDPAALKLSSAESDALYELRKGLDRRRRELDASRREGELDEAEIEKQSEAGAAQYEQQLKALLGEERYALLPTAESDPGLGDLRRSLRSMNASGEQLDAMTQAQQQWSEQRRKLEKQLEKGELASGDYDQQLKALEAARDQEYQKVLGADGYAEYQKAQDPRYRTMKRFGPAWGLSDGDINSLYGTIQSYESSVRDYQQRAQAIEEQGQAVDWPAVQSALQAYSKQTEEVLRKSLGEERFNKLKRNDILAWEQ